MAEKKDAGVFRQSAMNRIANADELDHYIKVANPSAWVVLLASLLLVGALFVWAVVAVVPVTIETTGVTEEGAIFICWVDKETAEKVLNPSARAEVAGVNAEIESVSEAPMSSSEVISYLGDDFLEAALNLNDWNYVVTLKPERTISVRDFTVKGAMGEYRLVPVTLIVNETQPINLVLGNM